MVLLPSGTWDMGMSGKENVWREKQVFVRGKHYLGRLKFFYMIYKTFHDTITHDQLAFWLCNNFKPNYLQSNLSSIQPDLAMVRKIWHGCNGWMMMCNARHSFWRRSLLGHGLVILPPNGACFNWLILLDSFEGSVTYLDDIYIYIYKQ